PILLSSLGLILGEGEGEGIERALSVPISTCRPLPTSPCPPSSYSAQAWSRQSNRTLTLARSWSRRSRPPESPRPCVGHEPNRGRRPPCTPLETSCRTTPSPSAS